MPQVEIWALPGQPLKEQDWLDNGYGTLKDYIIRERDGHSNHMKQGCKWCQKVQNEPLVSFGTFDPKTGKKEIVYISDCVECLPKNDIDGILVFNKT